MQDREYGLLCFHFVIDITQKTELLEIFKNYTFTSGVIAYTKDIDETQYKAMLHSGNFEETLTAYYITPEDFTFSLNFYNTGIEVWFGAYPGEDIKSYTSTFLQLKSIADYFVAGFEIDLSLAGNPEGDSPYGNFFPYVYVNGSVTKWYKDDADDNVTAMIEKALAAAGLL